MASLVDGMDALTTAAAPPFVCGITREMPEKPVELEDCGHVFDQDALRRWRAAGKTRCPECGGGLASRPSSVVAASLRAYRARSRRDVAVERDDVVVARGRPLGRGSHGVVKQATWRGTPVTVKQVPLDDDEAAAAMQRELKALRALRHPNVVALLGALNDEDEGLLWAILEFAPFGSLHRMLHRSSETDVLACFGDAKALPGLGPAFWGVAVDVCAALAFLHRRSVIHGDVKAANVLLGNGGVAKISDFGLARVVGTAGFTRTSSSHGGTAGYMAPELGEAGALDRDGASADVFAVAVLLAEVLTGSEPFADARNDVAIALRVRDGERPALPTSTPARLRDALMRCWDSNSAARPDAKDLLLDVLDLRLDDDVRPAVQGGDAVEVVRVTTTTGCKQLSSVLAEQGLRDAISLVRENEVDIEAARLMDPEDWREIGLDEKSARNVVASLGTDSIKLKVHFQGELAELTMKTT